MCMGSDPQSYLAAMDETVHRECVTRIKALERANNLLVQSEAAYVVARQQNELLRDRAYRAEERAEKAEGALQVAAAHNVELQEENDSLKARVAELEGALRRVPIELRNIKGLQWCVYCERESCEDAPFEHEYDCFVPVVRKALEARNAS